MSRSQREPDTIAGEIHADGMYTLAEIRARLGLGTYALREARRHGLPVRKIGRRSYVLGKDILAFAAGDRQGVANVK
ncbi:MAG: helix-turn-helix domain-containing protein [Planctomycetaceae bacterium]|nr:helix-turn-helix domain-containing protein [Planctomycetaceae bacterium]